MGHVRFNGLPLRTAPGRVMTPRRTTEQLVAAALERLPGHPARVVDVGTGSGAIAIALAAAAPEAEVWATDTSPGAVALARAVSDTGLGGRVHVRNGDLLEPVPAGIDLVVANLPYLPAADAAFYPDRLSRTQSRRATAWTRTGATGACEDLARRRSGRDPAAPPRAGGDTRRAAAPRAARAGHARWRQRRKRPTRRVSSPA